MIAAAAASSNGGAHITAVAVTTSAAISVARPNEWLVVGLGKADIDLSWRTRRSRLQMERVQPVKQPFGKCARGNAFAEGHRRPGNQTHRAGWKARAFELLEHANQPGLDCRRQHLDLADEQAPTRCGVE